MPWTESDGAKRRTALLFALALVAALGIAWLALSPDSTVAEPSIDDTRDAPEGVERDVELDALAENEVRQAAVDATLTLSVRDAHTGRAVEGAEIHASSPSPNSEGRGATLGTTDGDGSWRTARATAPEVPWTVRAPGYLPERIGEIPTGSNEIECLLHRSGNLSVECIGESGAKLIGCDIKLNGDFDDRVRRSSTTTKSGLVRFDDLPCGAALRITCVRRGQIKTASTTIDPATGSSKVRFTLVEADASVTGYLKWSDGEPVESRRKLVKIDHRGVRRASRVESDGRFTLVGLPVGQCYLRVDLPSHPSLSLNLVEGVNDVGVVEIDRLGDVRGRVLGAVDPASLVVDVITEGRVVATVAVANDSTFEASAPRGPVRLELRHQRSPYRTWLTGKRVQCPASSVELDAGERMGELRWSDSVDEAPRGVSAICTEMNVLDVPAGITNRWSLHPAIRSGEASDWAAGPLPFGTYDVFLDYGDDAGSWHRGVEIGSTEAVDLGTVAPGTGTLTITVDEASEEQEHEPVTLTSGLHDRVTVRVGAPTSLLPGPWQIHLPSPGSGLATRPSVEVREGEERTFVWTTANEGRIEGRLTGTLPTADVPRVTLKPLLAYESASDEDRATPDELGRFAFERVQRGRYELVCEFSDRRTTVNVAVEGGETTTVELLCPAPSGSSCPILAHDGSAWANGRRVVAVSRSGSLHEAKIHAGGDFDPPIDPEQTVVLLISRNVPTRELGAALVEVHSIAHYARSASGALEARVAGGEFTVRGSSSSALICHVVAYDGVPIQSAGAFRYQLASRRDEPGSVTVEAPPDGLEIFVREVTSRGGIRVHGAFAAGDREL